MDTNKPCCAVAVDLDMALSSSLGLDSTMDPGEAFPGEAQQGKPVGIFPLLCYMSYYKAGFCLLSSFCCTAWI